MTLPEYPPLALPGNPAPHSRRRFLRYAATLSLATTLCQHSAGAHAKGGESARLVRSVPPAYRQAALRAGVPARLLYAIALQESAMAFGEAGVLPWLWTLNVQGHPHRYATYRDAVFALQAWVTVRGVRNVDCGPMQVNWGCHRARFGDSFAAALEAHTNLAVGADILAGHYRDSGDWFAAAGRYHSPGNPARARNYANGVFARMARLEASA